MSEQEIMMMTVKDTFILIFFAVIENFGYRQIISIQRVSATLSALKENGKWGTQVRKGFKK